jgi:hypothetical protein
MKQFVEMGSTQMIMTQIKSLSIVFIDNFKMNKDNLHMGMDRLRFRAIGTKQILLATDAVSCWLLADDQEIREARLVQLLNCKTPVEFQQLVLEERANKNMHVDDSTVVLLRCS